ncbi:MAG: nuclear transport factor 2 family protein, partial [Pseudomonadota bacterium]
SMVYGASNAGDSSQTETNRALGRAFVETVLISRDLGKLDAFVATDYAEHNPDMTDGLPALRTALESRSDDAPTTEYRVLHRVLADGCFVLSVCEGARAGVHTSYYDLYRIEGGLIVEHWDTVEKIAPRSEWKNDNGKF